MDSPRALLHIEDLHTEAADGDVGLQGVSLDVPAGGAVALLGANGGGRDALCRCLAGRLPATHGTILFDGAPWPAETWRAARRGAVVILANDRVFADMSVHDNLICSRSWWQRPQRDNALTRTLQLFPALASRLAQSAGTLSGGEQQMLVLARALLTGARLVVMEEPWLGLAPRVIDDLLDHMAAIRKANDTAFLWTEEDRGRAVRHADASYDVAQGRTTLVTPGSHVPCPSL